MTKKWVRDLLPHGIAMVVFLLVAVIYCRPAFEDKVLVQEDVTQWKAMAQNSFQYKEKHGHFPLWTNGMFSGMPAYQIAMDAGSFAPQYFLYDIVTLYLKKPANFFFLACLCFYFLTQVLRVNPYIGIIGGLAYAYATYNPVIVAVGHDTKMQSIALLPAFIGGLLLIYEKKYWWGAALTALCTALFVAVNHMQIFYYGLLIAAAMTIGYCVRWIRQKNYKHLLIAGALAAGCVLIGVLSNAVLIFTTADFAKATIRGGSELAEAGSLVGRDGLSADYAFSYSMYPSEPFTLLAPKIFGGSDGNELSEENSKAISALVAMPPQLGQQLQRYLSFYWGGIGGTAGPAYAGAIICALALLGLFILDNKHKWWIAASCLLAILMSWGGYFASFNGMLLKLLPMYNKFRAPSVIMVIPVLLLGMLAMLTLQKILGSGKDGGTGEGAAGGKDAAALWKNYKRGLYLIAGVFGVLLLLYMSFDYTMEEERQLQQRWSAAGSDAMQYVRSFTNGLREDRQTLFLRSGERSFLFIAAAMLVTGLYIKRKMRPWLFIGLVGILAFIDIMGVDVQYLNNDNYKDEAEAPASPVASAADKQVLQDTGYYRVLDLRQGLSTALTYGAATAWWHHSVGGYNPAKLSIYEDLIEHQLEHYPQCMPVIDMLNTRYIIQRDSRGGDSVLSNGGALGAAWFVRGIRYERDARAVMNGLTEFDVRDSALVLEKDRRSVSVDPQPDSVASIQLVRNDNDECLYRTASKSAQFAVFSEVFYDRGWRAYLDDGASGDAAGGVKDGAGGDAVRELPIVRTNYVLRGVSVPAGKHRIRMVFHPDSYYAGQQVQRIAGMLLTLLLAGAVVMGVRGRKGGVLAAVAEKKI
ncbi:MAG TPA: hypothetical protein VNS58_29370 [Puia sp.]|nr:hypothetical protein [Puia sp.]